LEEINTALGQAEGVKPVPVQANPPAPSSVRDEERQAILQKVAAGQLSAVEALQKLQDLQGDKK
jgi:hypothetical protein